MSLETTGDPVRRTATSRRAATLPIAAAAVLAAALGGCSSDGGGGAFEEFVGSWTIDRETSSFALTCPFAPGMTFQISLWDVMDMQPGVLSDLVEKSGACPFFFDVTGKVATVPNPDPYTGEAPVCRTDQSDATTTAFLDFQPMAPWSFNLLAPEKGKPPRAQMIGSARAPFVFIDGTTGAEVPDPEGPCMYVVAADLLKISKN